MTYATCELAGPQDISVYELHVRDFSASDSDVPAELRGKYAAFCSTATGKVTAGQRHLQELSESGLSHVHFLPSYDFGSVPELPENQLTPQVDLQTFAAGAHAHSDSTSRAVLPLGGAKQPIRTAHVPRSRTCACPRVCGRCSRLRRNLACWCRRH